VLLSWLL